MQIELTQNQKGLYEIWCDRQCVREIPRNVGEPASQYQGRAEAEFDYYVEQMRRIQTGGSAKKVKSITL